MVADEGSVTVPRIDPVTSANKADDDIMTAQPISKQDLHILLIFLVLLFPAAPKPELQFNFTSHLIAPGREERVCVQSNEQPCLLSSGDIDLPRPNDRKNPQFQNVNLSLALNLQECYQFQHSCQVFFSLMQYYKSCSG